MAAPRSVPGGLKVSAQMDTDVIGGRGLVLLGCGKMGSALLAGWLARGIRAEAVWVIEPHPTDWLKALAVKLNDVCRRRPQCACWL